MASVTPPTFGKWRERFWPIHAFELKKILPLLFMKFFVSFTYGILTAMKDGFVVTARGGGAEVIPVLKGWIVLPIALLATLLYSKLSNIFERSTLFYGVIAFFMAFVALYGFYLFPNADRLSPHASADWLLSVLGKENGHWVAIYRNWIQALFFVVAELWGGVVIFLLFWGFVSQISTFNEAKRYYNLCVAGGDLAQMFTGPLVIYFVTKYTGAYFLTALYFLTGHVLVFCVAIMLLYTWLRKKVLTDPRFYNPTTHGAPLEQKAKLSLRDSLKYIIQSKHLRYIAIMVVGYGLTMSLVEVTWKANLKLAYPDTGAYQAFMAFVTSSVGITSFITATLFSGTLIRWKGWYFTAKIPPIVIGSTSVLFLLFYLNPQWFAPLGAFLGLTPLMLVVFFGAFHNISTKVCKYAFFDASKEMAYIPLDIEAKTKGKAAIDVIGARLGKSGSSWIQILLIQMAGTGSVLSVTHFLLPMVLCTALFWFFSVRNLNREFSRSNMAVT